MAKNDETQASKSRLQAELKAQLKAAEDIRTQADAKGWDEAAVKSYEAILAKTDGVKVALGLLGREDEMREFAHQSGGAIVPGTYAADMRESGPTEGTFAEAVIRQDWKSGELVGENAAGEQKVKALKSGAYKDAWVRHIRNAALSQMSGGGGQSRFALKGDAMKVLQEGVDTSGGLWVVPEFNATLIKKLPTMAVFSPRATHITVGSDRVSFPKVAYTTDDKYTSGVRYSWTGEAPASDISESTNPSAARTEINIFTATAAIILTREVMEDAQFDLVGYVSQLLSEAFILGDEDVIANGDGVGKPQGILGHPNKTTASSSGGMYVPSGQAAALDWGIGTNAATKGLTGLEAALPPQYENGAAFYGTKATYAAIRALVDGAGRPIWGAGEGYPNMGNGMQPTLLGYPVAKSQFLPAIGANTYPLLLGDVSGYFIADRVGITVEVLRELRALRGEVVLYARKRWGGQLVHDWKMKVQKVAAS